MTLNQVVKSCALVALMMLISTPALAQELSHEFKQELAEKTLTFAAINPYTNVPGIVTITISGAFHGKRIRSGKKEGWSAINGEQKGSFAFVPYDSSQPTYKGDFRFALIGEIPADRHDDLLKFHFLVDTTGSDGSKLTFVQGESALVNEYVTDVSFGDLKQLNAEAVQKR